LAISNKTEGVENDYTTVGYWNEKKEAWHDFLPGIKRRILVNNSAVTLTYYRLQPAAEVPLHSHVQAQFGICMQGGGTFTAAGKTWDFKAGDSYYIPPSVTHGLKVTSKEETTLIEGFTPMRREFIKETLAADGP
jgi:quercetin dioxygenase-like cupin family protein